MKNKYVVNRKKVFNQVKGLKIDKGYDMLTKNKIADISVNNINVLAEDFITNMINHKVNKRFKSLLELIASICESDEDPGSGLMFALTETDRFKRELINKYDRFLKKSQRELIDKKILLIEKEVKKRLYEYQLIQKTNEKIKEMVFNAPVEEEVQQRHR